MANIKKLKANGQDIVPITHEQAVLDSNGVTLDSKLNAINNAISRLENNSTPSTPSLEGNIKILTIGNYTITYNETDDTLDFLYNGVIDKPDVPSTPVEEVIPLSWAVGNLSGTDGSETVQDNALRSDFVAIETGYTYSFYLDTSFYDPSGVRVYFYDTNKTYISRTDGNVIGYVSGTDILIDVPTNAAYMRFKANASGTTSVDTIGSLFTLRKRNDEIVIPTWNDGKSISGSTGEIVVNEAAMVTDPIAIDNNYNYTIRYNPTTTNEVRIAFYDSSQGFISRSDYLTSGNKDTLITFPENTAYFRIKTEKVGITVNEANNNIIIKKVRIIEKPIVNSYVTEGLSMYIDATRNSISDITGNHTITNHGVTHTSDNNYLNFVASESDYLDTDFVPNLAQWSAEVYFQITETPTNSQNIVSWGVDGNRVRIYYSGSKNGICVQTNNNSVNIITSSNLLEPHHLIITMNNKVAISYLDGVKIQLPYDSSVQTSHTSTLKIGTKHNGIEEFINMNLRMFRFYDGKVLSDEEVLQNYRYETKNTYVKNGLSLYIDADDASTHGSIRDITGNYYVTNHGVSTTLDNGCLNFVKSESDYLDAVDLVPNLATWTTESYFYFTDTPSETSILCGWGTNGSNRVRIGYGATLNALLVKSNTDSDKIISSNPDSLVGSLHHLVVTKNNNILVSYLDGVKIELDTNATNQTSHTSILEIGTRYDAGGEFANMHLKTFRFYDGKALTEEEVLQNYNYELSRGIIKPTWIYNQKPDSSTGQLVNNENNACTEFIPYDSSYNYTLAIDTVEFFRVFYYDSSQSYIKNDSIANNFNGVINPPENTAYMRLKLARKAVEFADLDNHVIFRKILK